MRRIIATVLCAISLIFSLAGVLCCLVGIEVTKQVINQSQVVAFETAMRTYADSLDSMRDNIDVTGSQIPVYALTLKKTAKLFEDAQKAADELEKLTAISVANLQPFGALEGIAQDLREFLPQFSKSLGAAEKSLAGYTPENHEKVIDTIDKTVLLLKTNADKLEEQVMVLRRCITGFLTMCIFAGLAHAGLAVAILLVIPMANATQGTTEARRRVSFM